MKKRLSLFTVICLCTLALVINVVSTSTAASGDAAKPNSTLAYPPSMTKMGLGLACADCHGPGPKADYSSLMQEKCTSCHDVAKLAATTKARLGDYDNVHDSKHWGQQLACTVCHSVHKSPRNLCLQCHEQATMKRIVVKKMPKEGSAHDFSMYAFLLLLLLVAAHAIGRLLGTQKPKSDTTERVLIFPACIRIFHWLNAALCIIMLYTGLSIHFLGASWAMATTTATSIHKVAGVLLALNFIIFLWGLVLSGEIRQYLPQCDGLAERLRVQTRYYLVGIFKGEQAPFATTREQRFNPLQQIAYLVVFILGMPLLIITGAALFCVSDSWLVWVHYGLAVVYGLFMIVHIYLATTGKTPGSLIKGMIDGYYEK